MEEDFDWSAFDLSNTLVADDLNAGLPDDFVGGPFFRSWEY